VSAALTFTAGAVLDEVVELLVLEVLEPELQP
jgi:hypothetical protein